MNSLESAGDPAASAQSTEAPTPKPETVAWSAPVATAEASSGQETESPQGSDPVIASSVTIPAANDGDAANDPDSAQSEGGEWELLSGKIRDWWQEKDLGAQWQRLRQPVLLAGGLVGLILVLRIYSGILAAIATVPMAPRLFELVGVSWLAWFSMTRLIRSDERRKVVGAVTTRWQAFRGGRPDS